MVNLQISVELVVRPDEVGGDHVPQGHRAHEHSQQALQHQPPSQCWVCSASILLAGQATSGVNVTENAGKATAVVIFSF
jgi:hypothetical protein